MLRKTLLLTIAAMFALSTSLAMAAPPWAGSGDGPPGQSKKGKGYGKQKKNKHRGGGARASGGPPPWAPAHGYRRKQGGTASGGYAVPFDIGKGTCNRTEIGAVIGGVAGGALGSRVAKGDSRLAGTLIGTIAGAVIGVDRAGHQAPLGSTVEVQRRAVWVIGGEGLLGVVVRVQLRCRHHEVVIDALMVNDGAGTLEEVVAEDVVDMVLGVDEIANRAMLLGLGTHLDRLGG